MPTSKSSNAVMAIARTKYGNRITDRQLAEMASLQSVGAVADYLKNTKYGAAISKSGISNWSRSSLEQVIKSNIIEETYSLCAFEKNLGSPVFYAYMLFLEADEIISFLRCFAAGYPERYILSMNKSVDDISELDLVAMSQIRKKSQLVDFFKKYNVYSPLAQSISNQSGEVIDLAPIEVNLDKLCCNGATEIFKRYFSGKELDELLKLYRICFEVDDISTVYRSKRLFKESPDIIKSLIVGENAVLQKSVLQKLIDCNTTEDFFEIIKKTHYGKYITNEKDFISRGFDEIVLETVLKSMHFSNNPATVAMAYITYLSVEKRNITHIVEGVRYNLPSDEIIRMLILSNKEG